MKNGINKKLLFLIAFLMIGMMFIVYETFAYYNAEVAGNESESTVAVTGGSLTINYQNNSGDIVAEKIMPGWSSTKSFTVTATIDYNEEYDTNFKIWYDMLLIVERNDFLTGSLEYLLTPINSDVSKEGVFIDDTYKPIPTGTNADGLSMGSGYLPDDAISHTYNLSLRYLDREEIDQTSEMEGKFYARVNVRGSNQAIVTIDLNGGTLSNFSLNSSNKSKIAKNSEIYIPAPIKVGYGFSGWEIVSGTGTTTGNNLLTTSSNITIKAIYSTPSFANDSWETIAANVNAGQYSNYNVGDTKEVRVEGFTNNFEKPTFTVRIANNSSYDCTLESKTACGFVVEFVDIITTHVMNPAGTYNGTEYPYGTNLGGWPGSAMYKYLNGDTSDHLTYESTYATIYSKLPSDLRSIIADTTVISGHGSSDTGTRTDGNWESTDKLYLLTSGEIYSDCLTENCFDTASYPYNGSGATTTRQLDYYANNGVTTSSYSAAIKNYYSGSYNWCWLRGAYANNNGGFRVVYGEGAWGDNHGARNPGGVAPAFRII